MPLKMNLDIMLPWLEWWGVDVGATRLFFRLDVQTQNEIWEELKDGLGSKPGARLMSAIRRAENEIIYRSNFRRGSQLSRAESQSKNVKNKWSQTPTGQMACEFQGGGC